MEHHTAAVMPFEAVATRALVEYELAVRSLSFIRHSDSATYRVETDCGAYLLRVHVPVTTAMGAHGADPTAVRSELLWLEALGRETDLVLQRPARTRHGELVTRVPDDAGGFANCSLLSWIEGGPYHRDLETPATVRQIGRIYATLQRHAERWELPAGFSRPRRDAAHFAEQLSRLEPAVADGRIAEADFAALAGSVERVIALLARRDEGRERWGIMHADGHKGNMLLHEGQIRLIDFSFCAFGDFMFDLGIVLSDMRPELHNACLAGYQELRALPEGYAELIEGCFLAAIIGTFSFWVPNPRAQGLLIDKVPQVVRDYANPFNAGEPFWAALYTRWAQDREMGFE